MTKPPRLWTLRLTCDETMVDSLEETLGRTALVVTQLPPQKDKCVLEFLFPQEPLDVKAQLAILESLTPCKTPVSFEIEEVVNKDWIAQVSGQFAPLSIGRWTIYGAAFRAQIKKDFKKSRYALQIDATSAFGTGEHPTTAGCLRALDRVLKRSPTASRWRLLDMGCGSGILAMAFVRATGGRALGVEMMADAVHIAQETIRRNGLSNKIQLVRGKGYTNPLVRETGPYDLIMANVFARPLCEMAKDLAAHLKAGGTAILSGILKEQTASVIAAHRQQGLHLVQKTSSAGWSVLELSKPIYPSYFKRWENKGSGDQD